VSATDRAQVDLSLRVIWGASILGPRIDMSSGVYAIWEPAGLFYSPLQCIQENSAS
jgi:hypothetical protein